MYRDRCLRDYLYCKQFIEHNPSKLGITWSQSHVPQSYIFIVDFLIVAFAQALRNAQNL